MTAPTTSTAPEPSPSLPTPPREVHHVRCPCGATYIYGGPVPNLDLYRPWFRIHQHCEDGTTPALTSSPGSEPRPC